MTACADPSRFHTVYSPAVRLGNTAE